jgi:transcriptional regulator with XRE-family HTH domain
MVPAAMNGNFSVQCSVQLRNIGPAYMELHQTIVNARKRKGLTQEELAERTGVTARTIQRIESGDGTPRQYTLKAIASALDLAYDELIVTSLPIETGTPALLQNEATEQEDTRHFLRLLCLSCFSYLVVPFLHFLIPAYLLKRKRATNPAVVARSKTIILSQIHWLIALHGVMLLTFIVNYLLAASGQGFYINYLHPVFVFYTLNMVVLLVQYFRVNQLPAADRVAV